MNGANLPDDDVLARIQPAPPRRYRTQRERTPVVRFDGGAVLEIVVTLLGAAVAIGLLLVILPARLPGL